MTENTAIAVLVLFNNKLFLKIKAKQENNPLKKPSELLHISLIK